MMGEKPYQERYKAGNNPSDISKPDLGFIQAVTRRPLNPVKHWILDEELAIMSYGFPNKTSKKDR